MPVDRSPDDGDPSPAIAPLRRVYVVLAHEQPGHLVRLCGALDAPDARCVVHFDASAGPGPDLPANAEYVPDPVVVNHGGFSQVVATHAGLRHAATFDPDYVFVLSGRDYPIRPDRELVDFLTEHRGQSFISQYAMTPETDLYDHISERYFVDRRMALPRWLRPVAANLERAERLVLPDRRYPFGGLPYRGSAYFALHRSVLDYLLDFLASDDGARARRFFRHSWGADEMIFHSIILGSPLAGTCRDFDPDAREPFPNQGSLHYIDWDPARERPAVLDGRDADALAASEHYFARKFDEVRSRELLDALDRLR